MSDLDELDRLAAEVFEGYLVRKDLAHSEFRTRRLVLDAHAVLIPCQQSSAASALGAAGHFCCRALEVVGEGRRGVADTYVPSPRHKHPWQSGARGTLCPRSVDGPALFAQATADPRNPGKRYGTDGDHAYCAHPNNTVDSDGNTTWHGFPISWTDVPTSVQRGRIGAGRIRRLRLRD